MTGRDPFGTRLALVDAVGALVRSPDLTAVGPFHPDGEGGPVAPAADRAGRWGYLNGQGRWLSAPGLEWAGAFDGAGLSRFRRAGLFGYADTSGTPVVAARFTGAEEFHHGLPVVRTEDGAGYADPTGRVVIGGGFDAAGPFGPVGLAPVRPVAGGACGYVDREGRPAIAPRFDGAGPFGAGGAAPVRVGELWGLVDTAGGWIVEPSFRLLKPFDENGLAYAIGGGPGDAFAGFVDCRGEPVLRRESEMDEELWCGLLKVGDGFARGFVDPAGRPVIEPRYAWVERFSPCGAAVACVDDGIPRWSVLRTDGSFTPSPHREPVTDGDGWVVGFDDVTGLAAFVSGDGAVVHVDAAGRDVCRVEASGDGACVALRDAAGRTVWEGTAQPGTFERAWPHLLRDAGQYVDRTPVREGEAAAVAAELLDRAPQPFHPGSTDPYDLDRLDEDDEEDLCRGAVHVVASVFLEAEALAEYPFLQDWTDARFAEIHDTVAEHLRAAYGPPLPADRAAFLRFGDGERSVTWQVGERLLVLQEWMVIGDGDVEMEIWLAAVDA
ncbi:WG repeat-containing protein [Streptomyces yangpuensis]|uniref:WG repeat-containing protein n=1 Tax=Streptomyces yangpuensis TaxID=1648182 RepID=UPI001428A39D|nr:WG repeat-containing protein [Streptomyces yangpuensis]